MVPKISRKDLLRDPDRFESFSDRTISWIKENTRLAVIIASCFVFVILVAIGGRIIYASHQNTKRIAFQEASDFATKTDSSDRAIEAFTTFLSKYPGSDLAPMAHLSLGRLYLNKNDVGSSIDHFKKAVSGLGDKTEFLPLALLGLATAYETNKEVPKAIETLLTIQEKPENFLKEDTLYQLSRLYRESGNEEKAKEIGAELLSQFPTTQYANFIKDSLNLE